MRTAFHPLALALFAGLALAGCGSDNTAAEAEAAGEPTTLIGKAVKSATDEARKKLADGNLTLNDGAGGVKAELSPKGDLIIGGTAVPMTDAQRALALTYRQRLTEVAIAGIEVGTQGADLAGKAVSEAMKGVFTGKSDEVEAKIEAEAKKIEAAATQLCTKLPALLEAQNQLAAALPAFQPYAKMDQSDIEDCGKDGKVNVDIPGVQVGAADAAPSSGDSTAAEAEAAK